MKRRGFTLVEMLVVVAIVGILALLAVSSYGVARKQAQIDIAVDSIVSLMREQQGLAKSGRVSGGGNDDGFGQSQVLQTSESEKSCYGMSFSTLAEEGEGAVQVLEMPYYSYKDGNVDYCDLQSASAVTPETQQEVEVRGITKFGSDVNEIFVVFKPPRGGLILTDNDAAPLKSADYQADPLFLVTVGLPNIEDEKVFSIDTITGLTERVYETE